MAHDTETPNSETVEHSRPSAMRGSPEPHARQPAGKPTLTEILLIALRTWREAPWLYLLAYAASLLVAVAMVALIEYVASVGDEIPFYSRLVAHDGLILFAGFSSLVLFLILISALAIVRGEPRRRRR